MTPANDNRPEWFDALLLAHEPYIRSRMFILERDSTGHEDLYQEIIAKSLEQWAKYRPDGNFAGWLYWIVRNAVRNENKPTVIAPVKATNKTVQMMWDCSINRIDAGDIGDFVRVSIVEPTQEYVTDISLALSRTGRPDEVLLSACGHSEADIARRSGVRAPTIHYRIKAARAALNDNNRVTNAAA